MLLKIKCLLAWFSELCVDLLPSSEFLLEARAGRMIQSDRGADLPDKEDKTLSMATNPKNGMWCRGSFSRPEGPYTITLNLGVEILIDVL